MGAFARANLGELLCAGRADEAESNLRAAVKVCRGAVAANRTGEIDLAGRIMCRDDAVGGD